MAFRNVIINERCKLEYSMNYFVCRKANEEKKILIDEIKLVMINSTQVAITSSLVSELSKKKVKIIFCDELHNPECEVVSYQNNFYSYRRIKEQIEIVNDKFKDYVWKKIVCEKILNQANNLKVVGKKELYNQLLGYYNDVTEGDSTNREGHSAKVYFNGLFGLDFNRREDNKINKYLNYGYSILLSSINREIKSYGYLTELGIHHIGESNNFNLSCDFIEPLRPLVDYYVITNKVNDENFKTVFIEMLTINVTYKGKELFLDNAIHLYILDLLEALKEKQEKVNFISYEL